MNKIFLRRAITVGAAASIAVAGAALGAPASHAETAGPATGETSSAKVSRSVSSPNLVGGKIAQGSTITIENKVERKLAWLIYWVKDTHPSCLVPVPYTSVWKVSGSTYSNDPTSGNYKPNEFTSGTGWTQIDAAGGNSWAANPLVWTQEYTVTCDPGTLATGGLSWASTLVGTNNKPNLGPTITVVDEDGNGGGDGGNGDGGNGDGGNGDGGSSDGGSSDGGNGDSGSGAGSLDTGSLGSLFG